MKRIILIIISWLFIPLSVAAGSTGVSKARVIVRTASGEIVNHDLVISNLSSVSQQYRLFLEGSESQHLASFIPSDFNLPPGESQPVLLRFRQSARSQQKQLAVLSYDGSQSGNLKIASGIKIPVYFIVPPSVLSAPHPRIKYGAGSTLSPKGRGDYWVYTLYGIDFTLFFIVCLLWQRRLFWRRRRMTHKISFV